MNLLGAIYMSASGVYSNSQAMQVSADNVSNLNTNGFKGSRASFADLVATATGGVFDSKKGLGSTVMDIEVNFSQGSVHTTDVPTDLAIMGRGFFMVQSPDGEVFYTRDGQFLLEIAPDDPDVLRLVNTLGYSVLGGDPEVAPESVVTLSPIEIPRAIAGKATESVYLEVSLDARVEKETTSVSLLDSWDAETDPYKPISENDYEYAVDVKVYDPTGIERTLKLYFDNTERGNQFEFLLTLSDPAEDWRGTGRYAGVLLWGTLDFGGSGEVTASEIYAIEDITTGDLVEAETDEDGNPTFTLNFTGVEQIVSFELKSYLRASPFAVFNQAQDGYPPGVFERVEIDSEGKVKAVYTNQQEITQWRIYLADFVGEETQLIRRGKNLFSPAFGAEPVIFEPGLSSVGSILSGSLESSNVELATEMVHLITLQRAFQSNVRVIATAEQMIEEFLRAR